MTTETLEVYFSSSGAVQGVLCLPEMRYKAEVLMPAWTLLIPAISDLLDRIIPDPDARENAKRELVKAENEQALQAMQLALAADQNQTAINAEEAKHPSLFVAGWRPFIGWVCGAAFAYHFIAQPLLAFLIANAGGNVVLPAFDMQELSTVLMGILGLGSLRTIEKIRTCP